MGGLLLNTKRISKDEYISLQKEVEQIISPIFGTNDYFVPMSVSDKTDFGDIDMNISSMACKPDWEATKHKILGLFPDCEHKCFQAGMSVRYKDFSIDFFCRPYKDMDSSFYFLSYNCLGNMIGKLARKLNLKFGESGLSYVYRRKNASYVKDILISKDFQHICDFLGLDYYRWCSGFTYEQMFEWVVQSPFFSSKTYTDPNGNLKKRIATERPTIVKFVKWLEANQINKEPDPDVKQCIISKIDLFFGTKLSEQIRIEERREAEVILIQEKFNGNMLIELLGINGKELGYFISDFKKSFTDFDEFVLNNSSEAIIDKILNFHEFRTNQI